MNLPGSLVFPVVAAAVYCPDDGVRRMILFDDEGGTFHFWGSAHSQYNLDTPGTGTNKRTS